MDATEYAYMYEEEERHWWYAGMRAIVLSLLPPHSLPPEPVVLDVGCGTGFNLGWLKQRYGAVVTGLDISTHALDFSRSRGAADLVQADAASLPLSGNIYDLVVCFDALTSLKSEQARASALREFLRVLKPGGRLLVRVAACDFLRGSHDAEVMTYHRYGRKELSAAIEAAGFRQLRLTSANTILFPIAALWRMLKKTGLAPQGSDVRAKTRGGAGLNRAFASVLKLEASILRRANLAFGLSILVLAYKIHPRRFEDAMMTRTPEAGL